MNCNLTQAERDRLIAETLLKLADQCSAGLAGIDAKNASLEDARVRLQDINRLIWELRWEVGPDAGGEPVLDTPNKAEAAE